MYIEQAVPGTTYKVTYGTHRRTSFTDTFLRWEIENRKPVMVWRDDTDNTEFTLYLYGGRICVGTSADPVTKIEEV
jgi:hypothetical protein